MGLSEGKITIQKLLHWDALLRNAGFDAASAEVDRLLESATGLSPGTARLIRVGVRDLTLSPSQEAKLEEWIQRRRNGEPLQYILGCCDFWGRCFSVGPGVLIPRFDTELLVQTALETLRPFHRVLELCAGSGCIGLTLAAETGAQVVLVEKSPQALFYLKQNAARIGCPVQILCMDILCQTVDGSFDMLVANPPYIPTADLARLPADVRREPALALDGGEDGLMFYRAILSRFAGQLRPGGRLLLECGIGQAGTIAQMLTDAHFDAVRVLRDYGGVARVVCGVRSQMEGESSI